MNFLIEQYYHNSAKRVIVRQIYIFFKKDLTIYINRYLIALEADERGDISRNRNIILPQSISPCSWYRLVDN